MTAARRVAVAAALALAIGGCQPLNHPFETETKGLNPLLTLKEGVGVTVAPIAGLPPTFGQRFAEAIAGALRDAEIPASVNVGNRGSFVVAGRARTVATRGGEREIELLWDVAAEDRLLGRFTQREHLAITDFDDTGNGPLPGTLAAMAQRSLAKVVPLVRDDVPAASAAAIAVGNIDGAPGDGAVSLKRALEFVFKQSDIPVAGADHADALTLVGTIEVGRPADGQQTVAIRWVLMLPDGRELGDVRQENAVPAGSLDRAWGNTALLVAEAAYDGIISLYEKAPGTLAR